MGMTKPLRDILSEIPHTILQGSDEIEVSGVAFDTRKINGGEVFVCIAGTKVDGHSYIPQAAEKGAAAVVVTRDVEAPAGVTVVKVQDDRKALALLGAAWYGHPSKSLTTIGITGTKGKTTTSYMICQMLNDAGIPCGLIGTVEILTGKERIPATHSTPESLLIQKRIYRVVFAHCH